MHFDQAIALFRSEKIRELSEEQDGLRFLKLRSLSRREYLEQLFQAAHLTPVSTNVRALFREAFDTSAINAQVIDTVIRDSYETERDLRRAREPELVSQLYRLQLFDWGGLHQNSLEKTIVDNYVKKITDFDTLAEKIDNELLASMRGYVLCSWYNHWTSIIIEDVFRDHAAVLPAVGQVKKIDFFIHDVPFDLKVTYLPEGFIKDRRRADGLRPELTLLRQSARRHSVHFDAELSAVRLLEDLWAKLSDHPAQEAKNLTRDLHKYRLDILAQCQRDPTGLITWLYENQGVRRFDASNRLFLVLVDTTTFFNSWKLKRARPLLDDRICAYLDSVGPRPGREIQFNWEDDKYTTQADLVFVVHE